MSMAIGGAMNGSLARQNFVAAGLQEAGRLLTRPPVEHQIETETLVFQREDDDGD